MSRPPRSTRTDSLFPFTTPFRSASGFAASVQPSAAQSPIKTGADGLVAGEVKIPVKDGEIPAYRAMPATGGPFPTVLLIHEIWGVHEYFQDVRSEEHTSELQSLMRTSYAVFCLKKKK